MNRPESENRDLFAIADLAREFGISTRAIRFYETKGLLTPERVGSTRVFRRRDRARLILILRGKRLGFTIAEIKDFLDLYDVDDQQVEQMRFALRRGRERQELLREQLRDVEQTLAELGELESQIVAHLRARGVAEDGGD